MSPSKALFFICISFIVGVFIESIIKIPQFLLWVFLFFDFFIIIIFLLFKKDSLIIFGFCFLVLIVGVLRMQISEFNIANDEVSKFNNNGKVEFVGVISGEPDVGDTFQNLKVKVLQSTILVTTNRYPEYKYLDKIKLTGKLEAPGELDEGVVSSSYKNYLMKDGIYSVMGFPKIEKVLEKHQYNIYSYLYEKVLFLKQKIRESIQKNFLPPQSSIMEGTILGDNGAMTKDLKNKLNITGLRHVIAVSGTHVVILSSIIMSLLLAMGLWRGQAFYVAIIFICVYIIITGLPASGVRAGIMGGLFLLSQKIGRQSNGSRIVVIACSVMIAINPLLLFYDIGFQLSFLAVLGLIYVEPLIKNFIRLATKDYAKDFVSIISTTFAAQIFTLPIMIYNFGNISFVSPITNLLILPIVYWLMVFGFLTAVAGIFSSFLGWILSIPCWFLLTYFVGVINYFSKPQMAKSLTNVSWVWVVVLYFIISVGTWALNKKYSQKFL